MITKAITALAVTAILFCACVNRATEKDLAYGQNNTETKQPAFTDSIPTPQQAAPPSTNDEKKALSPAAPKPVSVDWDKKIIKTADITAEVKDFKTFGTQTREISKKYGGYVAGEKQQETAYKIENILTLKVPVDMFDDMMNELNRLPVKIISKAVGSEDVTTEMVDTRSRIEAKKQVREKYMEFLKQSKNMEEVLQVQNEINGIQEQIETAAGRVNYLGHASAFSTINLTYYQVIDEKAAGDKDEAPGFSSQLGKAMSYGLDIIKTILLAIVTIWPLLLITVVALFLYKRNKKQGNKV